MEPDGTGALQGEQAIVADCSLAGLLPVAAMPRAACRPGHRLSLLSITPFQLWFTCVLPALRYTGAPGVPLVLSAAFVLLVRLQGSAPPVRLGLRCWAGTITLMSGLGKKFLLSVRKIYRIAAKPLRE